MLRTKLLSERFCFGVRFHRFFSSTHRRGFCGRPLVKTARTCGCSIYIKAKLADEHCPQGKW